jgi:Short C-terminal domain
LSAPATDDHGMFSRLFVRRVDTEHLETKVRDFGQRETGNPIRDEIALLRQRRDAGELSETEFATRVAELLGSTDFAPLAPR